MATAFTINRITLRQLAAAMALAMAIASLPPIGTVVIADRAGGPCFTLDICHPLQSLDRSSGTVAIARPAPPASLSYPVSSQPTVESARLPAAGFVVIPDPPPPKPLA